jgi:hypothetical protein
MLNFTFKRFFCLNENLSYYTNETVIKENQSPCVFIIEL